MALARYETAQEQVVDLVAAACRREAVKDCMETGNLVAVVSRAYGEARAKALLGVLGDLDYEVLLEAYRAILRWCGVYELAYRQRRDQFHQHT